jgi:hypothetical protein
MGFERGNPVLIWNSQVPPVASAGELPRSGVPRNVTIVTLPICYISQFSEMSEFGGAPNLEHPFCTE